MGEVVISARGLSKVYGEEERHFEALRGVDLSISRGERVAIVGKIWKWQIDAHALASTSRFCNKWRSLYKETDARELSARQLNKLRNQTFGFVFQQFFMNANDSVLNNVLLPLKINWTKRSARKKIAQDALRAVGLEYKIKSKAGNQKQRMCIARAIVNSPSIIFADEPTGNLDSETSELIEDLLFGRLQKQRNITLIIVTHDPEFAEKCDRQIVIKDGRLLCRIS